MKTSLLRTRYSFEEQLLQDAENILLSAAQEHEPALYHLKSGGQRMRLRTCLDACLSLDIGHQDSVALGVCIELLHNASLVHDDLQDKDEKRRGRKTVWSKYGENIAICSGDFLLAKAFGILASHGKELPLQSIIIEVQDAVSKTIVGQCNDIKLGDVAETSDYEKIAEAKSGPFIALPLVLPLIVSGYGHHVDMVKQAINRFAVAYQIADDIGDWQADAEKKRLNLVNLLRKTKSDEQAMSLAKQRAQYLLKHCNKTLQLLPNRCAIGIIKAANQIQLKLKSKHYV